MMTWGYSYTTGWWCGKCTSVFCTHSPWNQTQISHTIYLQGIKPIVNKAARWFDVFRTIEPVDFVESVMFSAMQVWRRQERSDKLQRRRQKRRHFLQSLRT